MQLPPSMLLVVLTFVYADCVHPGWPAAGKPILGAIEGDGLDGVAVLVVR